MAGPLCFPWGKLSWRSTCLHVRAQNGPYLAAGYRVAEFGATVWDERLADQIFAVLLEAGKRGHNIRAVLGGNGHRLELMKYLMRFDSRMMTASLLRVPSARVDSRFRKRKVFNFVIRLALWLSEPFYNE